MRLLSRLVIMLMISLLAVTVSHAQTQQIVLGEVQTGEITALQPTITYSFEGRKGDVIYFYAATMRNDQSFYARLFDASANLLIETGAFPFVHNFTLPETQTYTILVGNVDDETGGFWLLVDFYEPTSIVLDTETSNTLPTPAHLHFYPIDVQAGTLFRYTTAAQQLGVTLLNPVGELASFQGMYDNPALVISQFEQTGQYLFIISTNLPDGVDYRLFLESITPTPLTAGTPVTGSTQIVDSPVFSFQSPAGKAWELNAIFPQDGDRRMFVAQLDGRFWYDVIIATDSGSGPNANPRISPFIAPADATYYVWLEFNSYESTVTNYDYEILLSSTSIISLAPDVEISHTITPETGSQTFIYTTTAENERIQLEIRRVSATGAISLQIFSPVDDVVFVLGREMNGAVFDLNLPVIGLYRFVVSDIGYDPTELTITIRLSQLQDKS
ncbi:MAG: hypothetical protein SFZ02_05760 [bacterium]|nr:hypothetical protein [bacterium]